MPSVPLSQRRARIEIPVDGAPRVDKDPDEISVGGGESPIIIAKIEAAAADGAAAKQGGRVLDHASGPPASPIASAVAQLREIFEMIVCPDPISMPPCSR